MPDDDKPLTERERVEAERDLYSPLGCSGVAEDGSYFDLRDGSWKKAPTA